jgi:RNAse (barnase) inhibitor barstar
MGRRPFFGLKKMIPMLIRREYGAIEMAWDVENVQGMSHALSESPDSFLISMWNLKARGAPAPLETGVLYSLWKVYAGVEFRISLFYVANNLATVGERTYLLALVGEYDGFKSMLLDAWSDGLSINWSDLSVQYGDSWLTTCRALASKTNWIQAKADEDLIVLDAEGLRSEQDLYCRLGEAFFGPKGYAGTNLDALYDVLRVNRLDCKIAFKDRKQFSAVCETLTNHAIYFDELIRVFLDAGLRIQE